MYFKFTANENCILSKNCISMTNIFVDSNYHALPLHLLLIVIRPIIISVDTAIHTYI